MIGLAICPVLRKIGVSTKEVQPIAK